MKSVSNILHDTPWWLLLAGGIALLAGLSLFALPLNLMHLDSRGATAEEKRAISNEVDSVVSERALDFGRGVLKEMLAHTQDQARRDEIEEALRDIDSAQESVREAGAEVLRAKRQAAKDVAEAIREAHRSILEAKKETARVMKEAGVDNSKVNKALKESLAATAEAAKAANELPEEPVAPVPPVAP